jgi:LemA protein
MTKPMVLGLLVAIALFWAVGAYNRLVRLRSEVVKAYSALDNVLSVHPAVIKAAQPLADVAAGVSPLSPDALWSRLVAAGEQFAQALANARAHPLDPDAIRVLSAARGVLTEVWQATDGDSPEGSTLPESLRARLAALDEQAALPAAAFDASVRVYNLAIRQFPALILAGIWSFKPAGTLDWPEAAA